MTWLNFIGIADALAQQPAAQTREGSFISLLPMLIVFIAIFYFFMIRPQSKRAAEQKKLMESLTTGDEILTTGGIVGKITRMKDNYVTIETGKNVEITIQKNAIASILPKGSLDNLG